MEIEDKKFDNFIEKIDRLTIAILCNYFYKKGLIFIAVMLAYILRLNYTNISGKQIILLSAVKNFEDTENYLNSLN